MPLSRDALKKRAEQEITVTPDTQKAEVLAVLARNPNTGYRPKDLAAQTPVPQDNIYPILDRLREDELVEKIQDHYLIPKNMVNEIQDIILTTRQSAIAADINNRNTAPETVETKHPADLDAPTPLNSE